MEMLGLGSLDGFLEKNQGILTEEDLLWMSLHVARGLAYLHSKKILHNDLAARNVLLTKNDRENDGKYLLKVSDFGLSVANEAYQQYFVASNSTKIPVR